MNEIDVALTSKKFAHGILDFILQELRTVVLWFTESHDGLALKHFLLFHNRGSLLLVFFFNLRLVIVLFVPVAHSLLKAV